MGNEKLKEYQRKYYKSEKYKKWRKEWYRKWVLKKGVKEKLRDNANRYYYRVKETPEFKEKRRISAVSYGRKLKVDAIQKLGGECVCCGEANLGFLTFDHVNGDGKEHRKIFRGGSYALYRDILKNEGKFKIQILCYNCNCGRQSAGGKNKICPHKLT